MPLKIPDQHIPGISKLIHLDDTLIDKLIEALAALPPTPDEEEVVESIAPSIDVDKKDLQTIVTALYALYHVREYSDEPSSAFVSDFLQAIRTSDEPDLAGLSSERLEALRTRFSKLLSIESVGFLSKALTLQRDGERLFCPSTKILSDIRPVFSDDAESEPAAVVVTHTLKLSYHEGTEHKHFFVVLDSIDLAQLGAVVTRALEKESTLQRLLTTAGLKDLGI